MKKTPLFLVLVVVYRWSLPFVFAQVQNTRLVTQVFPNGSNHTVAKAQALRAFIWKPWNVTIRKLAGGYWES
jgi:hypothetical protein